MERVRFLFHKGKRILLIDFSNGSVEDILGILPDAAKMVHSQPPGSVLTLTDVSGSTFDARLTQALKEFASGNKPYVRASAITGMTGLKKIVYDAVMRFSGRNIPIFDDLEKAKDWLVAQA